MPALEPVDDACRVHDISYGRLQQQHGPLAPYISHSDADEKFVEDMKKEPGILPAMYGSVFELKSLLPLSKIEDSVVGSFSKMPGRVKRSRPSGKRKLKRRRRRSKAIKRVTRLHVLKAIGSRFLNQRAYNVNMRHVMQTTSNRSRIYGLCGLGDWQDFNQMMTEDYGPYGYIGDAFWNNGRLTSKGVEPNYVLSNYAQVELANVANSDVKCRIIKFNLTRDYLITVSGYGAGETNVPTTSCLELFKYIQANLNPGLHTTSFATDLTVDAGGTYGDATAGHANNPPALGFTSGSPLPFGGKKDKGFKVKYGPWFKLEPGQSTHLRLKGKKGYIPTAKMALLASPTTLGSHQTMQMTPMTVIYGIEIQKIGHSLSASVTNNENIREAYIDGSFRVVADVVLKSVCLGQHNFIQGGVWAAVSDQRPNILNNANEVAMLDIDDELQAVDE